MSKNYKVTIIVAGLNEQNWIQGCLQSCFTQTLSRTDYEVIYVDNGSSDLTVRFASHFLNESNFQIIHEKKHGLSEARNAGARAAKGEILLFLDADAVLDKRYLELLINIFKEKEVGIVGGKVKPFQKTLVSRYLKISLLERYPAYLKKKNLRNYPGCDLCIRSELFYSVGAFREKMVTGVGISRFSEDKELCTRVRKRGYRIEYHPELEIWHDTTATFSKLIRIWWLGAASRTAYFKMQRKEPLSILFSYHVPISFLIVLAITYIFFPYSVIIFCVATSLLYFIYSSMVNYEVKESLEIVLLKPVLDFLSVITINLAMMINRLKVHI